MPNNIIKLQTTGMGLIFYSPSNVRNIRQGEDYFTSHFMSKEQVEKHAIAGTIVGFCTGSSGTYILEVLKGYPTPATVGSHAFNLRLGIEVLDGCICVKDLYSLMKWDADCPDNQKIGLANGFYHITLCSNLPPSGMVGDNQTILAFFSPLPRMPELHYGGVPQLCPA